LSFDWVALNCMDANYYSEQKYVYSGSLDLTRRRTRTGRNPATGQEIEKPAKMVVKMRVAKAAKEAIVPGKKK